MDHQFIHVDPEQAEPIFGSTIAHGFLSLSLVAGIPFPARNRDDLMELKWD